MSWEYYAAEPEPTREELKAEIERLRAVLREKFDQLDEMRNYVDYLSEHSELPIEKARAESKIRLMRGALEHISKNLCEQCQVEAYILSTALDGCDG